VITDLVQIHVLGEKKREENLRFRRHMKSHNHLDRTLRRIAEDIEQQIDCTSARIAAVWQRPWLPSVTSSG
jgi:hypothetical protein